MFSEILSRLRSDFQSVFQQSNPYASTGFLKAILSTFAGRFTDLQKKIQEALKQAFIVSATGEFLLRQGSAYGILPEPATKANGDISAIGVITTTIPSGTILNNSDGLEFSTTTGAVIATETATISSISVSNGIATAISTEHKLFTGNEIVISGANEADFNDTFIIEALDIDTFTFNITTSESSATGTIIFSIDRAIINVDAVEAGASGNLLSNENLEFSQTIPNVNSTAGVIFNGFGEGKDASTEDEYRLQILERVREPIAPFNDANIMQVVKTAVSTATRVFVQDATPLPGAVTVYFVQDDNDNILPSSATLDDAKAAILTIKSADIDDDDINVLAPDLVEVDFTFSSISPNTSSMKDSITANLESFFRNSPIVGQNILLRDLENVIMNTIDLTLNATLEDYTLSSPSSDIVIASNQLGILGNVTFN